MAAQKTMGTDELLLRDLADGLSAPSGAALSVGILGSATHAPQPPQHCLRVCLEGDPASAATRGCAVLAAAAQNRIDPAGLQNGCCAKGFQIAIQPTAISGEAATLVTVEGPLPAGPANPPGADLLTHLGTVSRVVQRVGQMLEENTGFANEVLQNYEQLNLIFDLTQQIARVTDARAIEMLLFQRMARLLGSERLCVMATNGDFRAYTGRGTDTLEISPGPATHEFETDEIVDFVRRSRQVRVAVVGGRQVIAAPLVRLDDQVDVVLAERGPRRGAFQAGDMMLVESILAFGGQIISNTELHERMRRMLLEVTRALVAAIDKKDHYTSGHSERGGFLTRLTAEELGVPLEQQQIMEWAGLLHDVGKIGIPEEILCKPGKLTKEEFDVIKQHPRMGYEILQPIASLGVILDGVLYHHEYPDGSGYPKGLVGDQIPLVARIIHVVDTFDALTSTRAYRAAFSIEKANEIIRADQGTRIDATVAAAFFRAFDRYRRENPEDFDIRFAAICQREAEHVGS